MKEKKPRKKVLKVLLEPYEKAQVVASADACGLTASAYARTLLIGRKPVNRIDMERFREVFKLHADLGRLGGLLKMLLTNDERLQDMGRDFAIVTIDGVLVDIRMTQALLKETVAALLSGKNKTTDTGKTGADA